MKLSFNIESTSSLLNNLVEKTRLNSGGQLTKFTKNSVIRGILFATASTLSYMRGYMSAVESSLYLSSCFGPDLDAYAKENFNLSRRGLSKSRVEVYIQAAPGTSYKAGQLFKSVSAVEFKLLEDFEVGQEGFYFAELESVDFGSYTKVYSGSVTECVNPPEGHIYCTNFFASTGGADNESDDQFRERLYKLYQGPATESPARIESIVYQLVPEVQICRCFVSASGYAYIGVLKTGGADFTNQELKDIAHFVNEYMNFSTAMRINVKNLTKVNLTIDVTATILPSVQFEQAFKEIQAVILSLVDPRYFKGKLIKEETFISALTNLKSIIDLDTYAFNISNVNISDSEIPFIRYINCHLTKVSGDFYDKVSTIPENYISTYKAQTSNSVFQFV